MDKTITEPEQQSDGQPQIRIIAEPFPSAGGLENEEEKALQNGAEKVQQEVHTIAVHALRFGAIVLSSIVLVRVWHVIGYAPWRWLAEADLQSVDKMLFSSAFGGLVLGYLKEIMKPLAKK